MKQESMKNYLLAVLFMLATLNASACKVPVFSLEQQVEKAEEIFIANLREAKVMPVDNHRKWPWIQGRFEVKKIIKGGVQSKEITLTTGLGRSDCGIGMTVSWNYIIFKGRKDTGIGDPSGTHVIEDFQMDELTEKIQSIMRQQKVSHGTNNSLK
ncbi:hypothetical protein SR858_14170 [Duganella zoogloeoides]|uniref:Lipoprotein n=1 Tax=Duganella zoogloeoides TaxID=75659 RepID=A0ABZ0XRD7_9BURK|nr:hypothetical protein [Duganella zoogloeoides]WQH02229.1 hypothetical protein SR858_14170 [Duganella zoogloeoides]